jgi:chromosome segregation ATPase
MEYSKMDALVTTELYWEHECNKIKEEIDELKNKLAELEQHYRDYDHERLSARCAVLEYQLEQKNEADGTTTLKNNHKKMMENDVFNSFIDFWRLI